LIEPIRLKFFISMDYDNILKAPQENIFEQDASETGSINKVLFL